MMIIMRLREREREALSGEFREAQSKVTKTLNQEKGVTSTPKSGGNDDEKTTTF